MMLSYLTLAQAHLDIEFVLVLADPDMVVEYIGPVVPGKGRSYTDLAVDIEVLVGMAQEVVYERDLQDKGWVASCTPIYAIGSSPWVHCIS